MNTCRNDRQAQAQFRSTRQVRSRFWQRRSPRVLAASGVRVLRFGLGALFVLLGIALGLLLGLAFGLVVLCRDERVARCLRLTPVDAPALAFVEQAADPAAGVGELSSEFGSAVDAAR